MFREKPGRIRVLFLNAPFGKTVSRFHRKSFSFGQLAVASNLSENVEVLMKDVSRMKREELHNLLVTFKPEHVGVTLYEHLLPDTKTLISFIRKIDPGVLISVGGPMPTLAPLVSLFQCKADFVFIGEAERTFREVIDIVGSDRDFRKNSKKITALWEVEGLHFLDARGNLVGQKEKLPLSSSYIDELPLRCSLVQDLVTDGTFPLVTSRGCPNNCIFCTKIHGSAYRAWSSEKTYSVLSQIHELVKTQVLPPIHTILFNDDDFFIDRERGYAIAELLAKADLGFTYIFQSNVATFFKKGALDGKLLDLLSMFKIAYISLGTESFNSTDLRHLRKPHLNVEKIWKLVEESHRRGIQIAHFMILSNPWTTALNFLDSLFTATEIMIRYNCPFVINLCIVPMFHSPLFTKLAEEKIPCTWVTIKADSSSKFNYTMGVNHFIPDLLARRTIIEATNRILQCSKFDKDNPWVYIPLFYKHLNREKRRRALGLGGEEYDFSEVERYFRKRMAVLSTVLDKASSSQRPENSKQKGGYPLDSIIS